MATVPTRVGEAVRGINVVAELRRDLQRDLGDTAGITVSADLIVDVACALAAAVPAVDRLARQHRARADQVDVVGTYVAAHERGRALDYREQVDQLQTLIGRLHDAVRAAGSDPSRGHPYGCGPGCPTCDAYDQAHGDGGAVA